jgi:hypothetical protein
MVNYVLANLLAICIGVFQQHWKASAVLRLDEEDSEGFDENSPTVETASSDHDYGHDHDYQESPAVEDSSGLLQSSEEGRTSADKSDDQDEGHGYGRRNVLRQGSPAMVSDNTTSVPLKAADEGDIEVSEDSNRHLQDEAMDAHKREEKASSTLAIARKDEKDAQERVNAAQHEMDRAQRKANAADEKVLKQLAHRMADRIHGFESRKTAEKVEDIQLGHISAVHEQIAGADPGGLGQHLAGGLGSLSPRDIERDRSLETIMKASTLPTGGLASSMGVLQTPAGAEVLGGAYGAYDRFGTGLGGAYATAQGSAYGTALGGGYDRLNQGGAYLAGTGGAYAQGGAYGQGGAYPASFECQVGLTTWQTGWSNMKKDWCCQHFRLGCPDQARDCGGAVPAPCVQPCEQPLPVPVPQPCDQPPLVPVQQPCDHPPPMPVQQPLPEPVLQPCSAARQYDGRSYDGRGYEGHLNEGHPGGYDDGRRTTDSLPENGRAEHHP